MSIGALDLSTILILFGWIPFWWAVALISLYRMNQNGKKAREDPTEVDSI
ncbi:hypothetical protein [Natrinema soli]|uniref:Uncharacterized protein n=1 Tax=Natrinema soli TaxID=1930624 RepID=A0ABD5SX59_9EURY|nr:hypothetical protein [Natrinema soli]